VAIDLLFRVVGALIPEERRYRTAVALTAL
jgi:hypothetical protein